jgi:hypothetical protein
MSISNEGIIHTIKEFAKEKYSPQDVPESGKYYLCIKEEKYAKSYSAEVAVGTGNMLSNMYYNISGFLYTPIMGKFSTSTLKIEPKVVKSTPGMSVSLFKMPDDFKNIFLKASWDGKLVTLSDLLEILKNHP